MGLGVSATSCQVKGMHVTKTGVVAPYNWSLMKKSEADHMAATGPGYTFEATTVGGDETIVPVKALNAYQWIQIARAAADAFKGWSGDKAATESAKINSAADIEKAKIAADLEKATFVPEPVVPAPAP
jgi:hypothetical protein